MERFMPGTGTWGTKVRPHYSRDGAFNRDGTLIRLVNDGGTPSTIFLDGSSYAVVQGDCGGLIQGDIRWQYDASNCPTCSPELNQTMWVQDLKCAGICASAPCAPNACYGATEFIQWDLCDLWLTCGGFPNTLPTVNWVGMSDDGLKVVVHATYMTTSGALREVTQVHDLTGGAAAFPQPHSFTDSTTDGDCGSDWGSAANGFVFGLGHSDFVNHTGDGTAPATAPSTAPRRSDA